MSTLREIMALIEGNPEELESFLSEVEAPPDPEVTAWIGKLSKTRAENLEKLQNLQTSAPGFPRDRIPHHGNG